MTDKIRIGLIGASVNGTWSMRSHLPALKSHPDFELVAVSTTKAESAEAARQAYGARLAFADYRAMIQSPKIDAVAVVVRVPSHFEPVKAALEAGKHVYCEWPLGRTTSEAVELTELAHSKSLATTIGLQARVHPAFVQMKAELEAGTIGDLMAVHVCLMRAGGLSRPSLRMWQRDASLGANTLTIANGHTVDALRFVCGEFQRLSAVVSVQEKSWLDTGDQQRYPVTSPDNVLISGQLENGAVASVHVGAVPYAGSGFRMELYGREGTLIAVGEESPQISDVTLLVARHDDQTIPIEVPERPPEAHKGRTIEPFNVGRMYTGFAQDIRSGRGSQPNFRTAVELHKLIDSITQASHEKREVKLAP